MHAPVAEYLRVDEIASRLGVSIDDVLAACSVLGFPVHDRDGLIELDLFTEAVKAAAPRSLAVTAAPHRRPRRVAALASAAAVVAVLAAFAVTRDTSAPATRPRAAASYRAALQSTYDATVADAPVAPDYRALARELAQITPPPELRAEHAALVAEAQTVAEAPSDELTTAVDTLRDHVAQLEATRVGR
jgi:hypothetical protein